MRVILTPLGDTAHDTPTEETSGVSFRSTKDDEGDLKTIVLTINSDGVKPRSLALKPDEFKAAVIAIFDELLDF